nr:MAG TPA: hypothetical protein [Caudoviricetes sp.]
MPQLACIHIKHQKKKKYKSQEKSCFLFAK